MPRGISLRRMRHARIPLLAPLAIVLLALGLAACGDLVIDPQKAEDEIAQDYEAQQPDSEVSAVACPEQIDSAVGTKVVCTMTLTDGATGEIDVEVLDEDGNISWQVANPSDQ